jgi:YgiT-type zinc finger domain-containing protein
MSCVFCGGEVESRNVTFVYDENDDCFFIENVPAEVCVQCGEKTYSPEVTDELLRLAKKKIRPARTLNVPVFDYAVQAVG